MLGPKTDRAVTGDRLCAVTCARCGSKDHYKIERGYQSCTAECGAGIRVEHNQAARIVAIITEFVDGG